jgi:predicted unusual protein kinase regulating ubiquinone biosynthesis (AarF/ABC1/UbiB family)
MKFEEVNEIFKSEFNDDINSHFETFSIHPIASASIGQVHVGRLRKHKKKVAIKVLRKRINNTFKTEIVAIMNILTWYLLIDKNNKSVNDIMTILNELYKNIDNETNFEEEKKNMRIFHKLFDSNDMVIVPRIYNKLCSKEILTMEYIHSTKITLVKSSDNAIIASELMKSFIMTLLNYGYIHCDPHPGNLGIDKDGKIVLYDYGMIMKFDTNVRDYFRNMFFAIVNRSNRELINYILSSGLISANESKGKSIDMLTGYENIFILRILDYVYEYLRDLDVNRFLLSVQEDNYIDINDIPFSLDAKLVYLFKSFGTLEGVCKELDADFNYIDCMSVMIFEFLNIDTIMDKAAFDIKSSQSQNQQSNKLDSYTMMRFEKLNKDITMQNNGLKITLAMWFVINLYLHK